MFPVRLGRIVFELLCLPLWFQHDPLNFFIGFSLFYGLLSIPKKNYTAAVKSLSSLVYIIPLRTYRKCRSCFSFCLYIFFYSCFFVVLIDLKFAFFMYSVCHELQDYFESIICQFVLDAVDQSTDFKDAVIFLARCLDDIVQ